jgi:hypothetical protein
MIFVAIALLLQCVYFVSLPSFLVFFFSPCRYEHRRHEVRLEEMKKIEELAEAQRRGDRELEMHIRRSVSAINGADGGFVSQH